MSKIEKAWMITNIAISTIAIVIAVIIIVCK